MYLWNDYEGKVLAGTFVLERLLRTEGRSGFFLTRVGAEARPAVIRLTESLNDDDRMMARYRVLEGLGDPNLQHIEGFGTAELDGTPLFYLVLEPSSESLAEVLRERPLSIEETDEVAGVVVGALESLHGAGFVHGLVEPESVLAAGERIKLRSDCAHPAPEPPEDAGARAADVRALADLLHRALTQAPLVDEADALALPEPYRTIVRQAVRGVWGLGEIGAELRRTQRLRAPLVPAAAAPAPELTSEVLKQHAPAPVEGPIEPAAARDAAQLPLAYPAAEPEQATLSGRRLASLDGQPAPAGRRLGVWIGIGVAAVLLLFALAHTWSGRGRSAPGGTASSAASSVAAPAPAGGPASATTGSPVPAARPVPVQPSAAPASSSAADRHLTGGPVWRVVAYTYHREDEAASKARAIAERHRELRPEVFSPSGHAPYLVTLGGGMSRAQAEALRARARRDGLARDVYVQNYKR